MYLRIQEKSVAQDDWQRRARSTGRKRIIKEAIKEKNIGINTDRNTADLQYWQTSYMYDWRSFQVKTYADKLTVPKPIHFGGCDMFHVSSA